MLRSRLAADRGFTLVELLVAMLIIGILMAVGIATFLAQRSKAEDADAKTSAVTAAKAMTIYHDDNDTFAAATPADLAKIEPSLAPRAEPGHHRRRGDVQRVGRLRRRRGVLDLQDGVGIAAARLHAARRGRLRRDRRRARQPLVTPVATPYDSTPGRSRR